MDLELAQATLKLCYKHESHDDGVVEIVWLDQEDKIAAYGYFSGVLSEVVFASRYDDAVFRHEEARQLKECWATVVIDHTSLTGRVHTNKKESGQHGCEG